MREETIDSVTATSAVTVIRSGNRNYLRDVRSKNKELLVGNKRLRLHDVSEYLHDVTPSEFSELLLKLKQKHVPLELLRKIKNSCISQEYIEAVLKNDGAFNKLIQILVSTDAQKQLEAGACLTNITCGSHKCSYQVAKRSGAYLISFIDGNSHFLQEQSSWSLGNIAYDCLKCFNIIKAQGVLPALVKILQSPFPSVIQCAVFALNACTQYEDPDIMSIIQSSFLNCLFSLLEQDNCNRSIFLDAAFTLCNCCCLATKYSPNHFDTKDVERILILLQKIIQNAEPDFMITTPLIRCLGFLSYDRRLSEFLALHPGFFKTIQILATKEDCIHLSKEAFWVLSNVTVAANNFNMPDLMPIIDTLKVNLTLESSVILQVLYFLSILASKNESMRLLLKQHMIFTQTQCLLETENKDVLDGVTIFLKIVQL